MNKQAKVEEICLRKKHREKKYCCTSFQRKLIRFESKQRKRTIRTKTKTWEQKKRIKCRNDVLWWWTAIALNIWARRTCIEIVDWNSKGEREKKSRAIAFLFKNCSHRLPYVNGYRQIDWMQSIRFSLTREIILSGVKMTLCVHNNQFCSAFYNDVHWNEFFFLHFLSRKKTPTIKAYQWLSRWIEWWRLKGDASGSCDVNGGDDDGDDDDEGVVWFIRTSITIFIAIEVGVNRD